MIFLVCGYLFMINNSNEEREREREREQKDIQN